MEQGIATRIIGRLFRVQCTSGMLCEMGCVKVREVAKNSAAKLLFEDKIVQKISRSSREPEKKKNSLLYLITIPRTLCLVYSTAGHCASVWLNSTHVHVREINVHVKPSRGM